MLLTPGVVHKVPRALAFLSCVGNLQGLFSGVCTEHRALAGKPNIVFVHALKKKNFLPYLY